MAFLSQASHLGSLLLPHDAFQEYAAHPVEWSTALNSKGSERTCIRSGLVTFLHCAFTAHSDLAVDNCPQVLLHKGTSATPICRRGTEQKCRWHCLATIHAAVAAIGAAPSTPGTVLMLPRRMFTLVE